ncbi:Skb1 methyltransferase [Annulohypoxylon maeteangense]|uniref:Skb1 methyltransferase n=1 Tax=Annulohypoxylon maeteangense TaxID=1927788 RepID=UPI00200820C1|nr:Skb1 methyltransferase [Annulohypoxylon maeteangense]KAI0882647.1 Skb1 methyltransferase [Annulohypoxylon maeteangense]
MLDSFDQEFDHNEVRPTFYIGQHDSTRSETLTDLQYGQVLNSGFSFITTPITNEHFHDRVLNLLKASLLDAKNNEQAGSILDPVVPPLTTEDTNLFPGTYTSGLVAYSSPWIDLCSSNHIISSISRQVLNLEVSYANFCGVRSIIVPGPREDSIKIGNSQGIAQYARAIHEAFSVGTRVSIIIHIPMYREPSLEEKVPLLSLFDESASETPSKEKEIDLFSAWDSWHVIRTVCEYDARLFVALKIPRVLPEKELQTRWFSEPLQYLTFGPQTFQTNKAGHPSLSHHHQDLIFTYMRLKNAPYFLLCDVGPEVQADSDPKQITSADFPTLVEAAAQHTASGSGSSNFQGQNGYSAYLRHLERHQEPLDDLEQTTLTGFQDWLQSPLQPLSDNLESVTYEVFEGDPVKYFQYEMAIAAALKEWDTLGKPKSGPDGEVVIAVAGSGRGPLVTRALRASESTGVPVRVWAVEKNPNAYVYLLRQNQREWNGRVTVVKTDMRAWKGPLLSPPSDPPVYGKVDILVSELLGSFADNELSPECLDGIQHVLAPGSGISIPASYTAHASPISSPRIHADIRQRAAAADANAFDTPWVVRLFAIDFVAAKGVPDHPRFQQAWEFAHPLPKATMDAVEARRAGGVAGGGGGSMAGAVGANDHNARHCCMTFVCRTRGVVHGLAGYFEAVLYESKTGANGEEEGRGMVDGKVELSTLPDLIQRKSKDMISWFPIFFPLKEPLYFPPDTELEVSMWRQTDDAKVWYEWMVEAFMWVSPSQRVKVGGSELCSSRKVACLL